MPPVVLPSLVDDESSLAAYRVWVEGERIDAETCDGIAAGED